MTAAFSLRRHYPITIEYSASETPIEKPANLDAGYSINLGPNNANPLDWRVALTVSFLLKSEEKELAKGKVVYVGYFNISNEVPEADRQIFVAQNGASVLYSATRELVANLTCRSTNRHILLPLTTFQDIKLNTGLVNPPVEAES